MTLTARRTDPMPTKRQPKPLAAESTTTVTPRDASGALADACRTASVCDQFRGHETLVLDVTRITALFDYFVITTANNRRQMHSIADEVSKMLKRRGAKRLGREGYDHSSWIVEDFGDVILHVFSPESRELYDLENLWGDAARVDWQRHLPTD
jgi:ribosome-associated protein